ncbi:MAG TPA: hypothetical protein PKB15_05130 [Acidimicrobiia bacterium]|nr:hypothetical protein [Acidimicrobiia bacterium]
MAPLVQHTNSSRNMTEDISEELEEIASRLSSHRGAAEEQTYSGSTGDIVARLEKIGIHTHKAKVAEVADLLFGDDVRSRPSAHRRIDDRQFEILARAFLLYVNFSYEFEEIAGFIKGKTSYDDILFRLKAGLVLIDEIGENAGVPTPLSPGAPTTAV